jgi:lipoprotein-anchoring transpeptidase ErfK/SrfK
MAISISISSCTDTPNAGVDIPNAGVDIPNAGVDIPNAGVDTPNAGVDIPSAGVDIPSAGVDIPNAGVDIPKVWIYNKLKPSPTFPKEAELVAGMPETQKISSAMVEQFAGWAIDSVCYVDEYNSVAYFRVKGIGLKTIAGQTMQIQSDSATKETYSYVILSEIVKNKPFEFDVLYIPTAGVIIVCPTAQKDSFPNKTDLILVSKRDLKLRLINYADSVLHTFPVATGKNAGNKKREGDNKTPEGIFTIYAVHDASGWDYDFNDGNGRITGIYGKYFIRFKEHHHIGIHGTHLPETAGSRSSEGCIRMRNEDINSIVPMISTRKTLIVVTPAYEDVVVDG